MSALRRLKAYFGMVPAEELDAAGLEPARLDAPHRDDYRPPYASPRMHSPRPPAWATQLRDTEPRIDSWAPEASVRGSLAIDTAVLNTRSTADDERVHPATRIVTLHPRSYNEARPIGERYRDGNPVIMNLTAMEDRDAKRLVDFAAGLAFALRGSIDKITNKVFLLSPPHLDVSAEDRRRIAEGHGFN